jgi:hypothetical protein
MIMPQVLGKVMFSSLMDDGLEDEEHLENVVAIFLEGLRPGSREEQGRSSP